MKSREEEESQRMISKVEREREMKEISQKGEEVQ